LAKLKTGRVDIIDSHDRPWYYGCTMQESEGLGVFSLRRETGGTAGESGPLVLYDSKDLLTHAVCVGMTGLCIGLLEEAALDAGTWFIWGQNVLIK